MCTVNRAVMTVPDDQRMSVGGLWMLSACALNVSLTSVSVTWRRGWEPAPFLLRPHLLVSKLINQKDVTVRYSPLFFLFCCIINVNTNTLSSAVLSEMFNKCVRIIDVLLIQLLQRDSISCVSVKATSIRGWLYIFQQYIYTNIYNLWNHAVFNTTWL